MASISQNDDMEIGQPQAPRASGVLRRRIGLAIVILSIVASVVTFMLLTGLLPIEPSADVVNAALALNGLLVLGVLVAIAVEGWKLWQAWRERRAGSRLHLRIVLLFSIIAAVPAVLVAVGFSITLDRGLDRWFEERTRQIVDNAVTVGTAYLQEHASVLRGDLIGMATALDAAKPLYDFEPGRFDQLMEAQTSLRGVEASYLLDTEGNVIVRTEFERSDARPMPPRQAIEEASTGTPVLISPGSANYVGGLLQLRAYDGIYLYLVRALDPNVLDNLRLARDAATEYSQLAESRSGVQLAFGLIFSGLSLVLLLGAIWVGIAFASGLVSPIRRLMGAAEEVSKGNLNVEIPTRKSADDLSVLGRTFNNMTRQLRTQRGDLLNANDQLDRRRRFTEAVLSGVTAAVVGVTNEWRISLANRSAANLLGIDEVDLLGRSLIEEVPELEPLLAAASRDEGRNFQGTITVIREGRERTVSARVASDRSPDREHGYVVTLDDITDLVTAQRTSAWADVARRIAHEIKNPLTPIQLSAERIRRRYGKVITEDRTVFDQCIETIVRQVGDIGRMVDEFSAFARMPKPAMEVRNVNDAIREAVFLMSVGHPEVTFATHLPDAPLYGRFDHRLVSQALTNLVKNATEAIAGLPPEHRGEPRVDVHASRQGGEIVIDVVDTGIGLPADNRVRLLEPYMTTREKGTGLGLAIVTKIVEEHEGRIELLDSPEVATGGRGALVRMTLPAADPPAKPAGPITEKESSTHGV